MRTIIKALILILVVHSTSAQQKTISGYIEDSYSKERLIGANVSVEGTKFGTTSNRYGFYSITLPVGNYTLLCTYVGYKTKTDTIVVKKSKSYDFQLVPDEFELGEVEVSAKAISNENNEMSTISLSQKEIESVPILLGETDVLKTLQLLPGVQGGVEGTAGFHVRGGSPDQNLILLDGVPVYNASHLFGFFSVFNSDAIKNVQLTKGGFPARYGGRLSSILEVNLKEGNMQEFHGEGSIGFISSKLTLEGPIIKDKASFMVSGRRSYYDLFAKLLLPPDNRTSYHFGDISTKLNYRISRKDRLYLSLYGGTDSYTNNETVYETAYNQNLDWGNTTGSLRWNHLFSDKLFGNLTATYTRYRLSTGQSEESINQTKESFDRGHENSSTISDWGLNYNIDHNLHPSHNLKYGLNYIYHTFNPSMIQLNDGYSTVIGDSLLAQSKPVFSHEAYIYAEDLWKINHRLQLNYGLHYSIYKPQNAYYNSLQPRVSSSFLITDQLSLKASYALMNQYVHLLSNTGLGIPTDLWVSSTENIKPQQSQQYAIGTEFITKQGLELSAELYYKSMENLIAYKEGATFEFLSDWEGLVESNGEGQSYGLELLTRKKHGNLTGWLAYTLAWSNRTFSNINSGETFPYKYDRRHNLNLVANYTITKSISAGATWTLNSGHAFTSPTSVYWTGSVNNDGRQLVFDYSSRNELRYPTYHRLDLSVNFRKETKWGRRIWSVSIYNAYNRKNAFYIYARENEDLGRIEAKQVTLFPIIPSISYIFKF